MLALLLALPPGAGNTWLLTPCCSVPPGVVGAVASLFGVSIAVVFCSVFTADVLGSVPPGVEVTWGCIVRAAGSWVIRSCL